MGVTWSAADIERGMKCASAAGRLCVVLQGSNEPADNKDTFTLSVPESGVIMPKLMNAAQMALFLTEKGFTPWEK